MIHNIHYVLYCPLKMYCRYMFYKTLKFIIKKREENKKMKPSLMACFIFLS